MESAKETKPKIILTLKDYRVVETSYSWTSKKRRIIEHKTTDAMDVESWETVAVVTQNYGVWDRVEVKEPYHYQRFVIRAVGELCKVPEVTYGY